MNLDDAPCCTLCFEPFKARAKPSANAGRMIAFPSVSSSYDADWRIEGPLVIDESGFHFFIKTVKCTKPTTGDRIGHSGVMKTGAVGFLLGAAVGAAIDAVVGPGEQGRPDRLRFKKAQDVLERFRNLQKDAPDIPHCREYFSFPREEVFGIAFGFLGGMTLTLSGMKLVVGGVEPVEKATAFFKIARYPLED